MPYYRSFASLRFDIVAIATPDSKLSLFLCLPVCRPIELTYGRGRYGVGGGAKSYDGEKAWSAINNSIFSGKYVHKTKKTFKVDNTLRNFHQFNIDNDLLEKWY
jgi:hypothetical protein